MFRFDCLFGCLNHILLRCTCSNCIGTLFKKLNQQLFATGIFSDLRCIGKLWIAVRTGKIIINYYGILFCIIQLLPIFLHRKHTLPRRLCRIKTDDNSTNLQITSAVIWPRIPFTTVVCNNTVFPNSKTALQHFLYLCTSQFLCHYIVSIRTDIDNISIRYRSGSDRSTDSASIFKGYISPCGKQVRISYDISKICLSDTYMFPDTVQFHR